MKKPRVVVAMSGGVDSSVAAAVLKDEGYDVIGVTMQIWLPEKEGAANQGVCCGGISEIEDARRVAHTLGIPHYVADLRDTFTHHVIDNFCREYSEGRTPNPCIQCNQYVKFGALLQKAAELGAHFVASGHHAMVEQSATNNRYLLKKGTDHRKDQSYVLYRLSQEQLAQTLFPIGRFTKDRVREIARDLKLSVAAKADSQEICFISDNDYPRFLTEHISQAVKPGPILNSQGTVLGEHKGIQFYTIGQRKRLGISSREPLFVTAILPEKNAIVVGSEQELYCSELVASELNWLSLAEIKEPIKARAKIRYTHREADVDIIPLGADRVLVRFAEPQKAATPGQSVVFYNGDIVIGGGIIETVRMTVETPPFS